MNEKLKIKIWMKNLLSELNKNLFNDFINSIKKCVSIRRFLYRWFIYLINSRIKEGRDLNFICLDNNISFPNEGLKNHKEIKDNEINYTKEDILYNPNHHFLFNGINV